MASITMMIGGTFLNATSFTSSNYFAKQRKGCFKRVNNGWQGSCSLSGCYGKIHPWPYQTSWLDHDQQRNQRTSEAKLHKHRLHVQTLYPDWQITPPKQPHSQNFINPVRYRNKASCLLWAAASARLSGFSFSLNFSRCYISLLRTCSKSKDGLSKVYYSPEVYWKGIAAIKNLG